VSAFLLDSHALLWTLYQPDILPLSVVSLIEDKNTLLYVSDISQWEIIDKATKFRLPMAGSSADQIAKDIWALDVTMLPIELDDIVSSVKLPRHHNDPMDRLLIAQARRLGATLLSRDGKFKHYDVPIFWG
jgi:PIN domain nuclease of toxin-antitoxin system